MKNIIAMITLAVLMSAGTSAESQSASAEDNYSRVFSKLALSCIHQEYTNKISHYLNSDEDVKPPRELYPAFYGCFDWHSSVHGHWLLVRLLNTQSDQVDSDLIIKKLQKSFTADNLAGELKNYQRPGMKSFERPYGIAWFFQLTAELRQSSLPQAKQWLKRLMPFEQEAKQNISKWLPNLTYPIRVGTHAQTAFAFGLMLDWSRIAGEKSFELLLSKRIKSLYLADTQCPLNYEPSGHDFLSPCISEADLMRRVLNKAEFAKWLTTFLPEININSADSWLTPGVVLDKSDGHLAHLDGLNLSRAWMLEGIVNGLPANDPRIKVLTKASKHHRKAGLNAVLGDMHYMGSHWLGSFATYLQTQRGIN